MKITADKLAEGMEVQAPNGTRYLIEEVEEHRSGMIKFTVWGGVTFRVRADEEILVLS